MRKIQINLPRLQLPQRLHLPRLRRAKIQRPLCCLPSCCRTTNTLDIVPESPGSTPTPSPSHPYSARDSFELKRYGATQPTIKDISLKDLESKISSIFEEKEKENGNDVEHNGIPFNKKNSPFLVIVDSSVDDFLDNILIFNLDDYIYMASNSDPMTHPTTRKPLNKKNIYIATIVDNELTLEQISDEKYTKISSEQRFLNTRNTLLTNTLKLLVFELQHRTEAFAPFHISKSPIVHKTHLSDLFSELKNNIKKLFEQLPESVQKKYKSSIENLSIDLSSDMPELKNFFISTCPLDNDYFNKPILFEKFCTDLFTN